mgnify:CR=1 FL=1
MSKKEMRTNELVGEVMWTLFQEDSTGRLLYLFIQKLCALSTLPAFNACIDDKNKFVVIKKDEYEKLKEKIQFPFQFDLQLTSSECDFIIECLEPLEEELGMIEIQGGFLIKGIRIPIPTFHITKLPITKELWMAVMNDYKKRMAFILLTADQDKHPENISFFINRNEEFLDDYDWDTHTEFKVKNPYYMSNHEDYEWYYKGN